jgi:hypothetical protein
MHTHIYTEKEPPDDNIAPSNIKMQIR